MYAGLVFFVVNVIAIALFNITGTLLVVVNILPTIFAIIIMLKAFDKI